MNLNEIKEIINKEKDDIFLNNLLFENMLPIYKKSKSVKLKIQEIETLFKKFNVKSNDNPKLIENLIKMLIPAGTKGVIDGNLFNDYIKNLILQEIKFKSFIIKFEEKHHKFETSEKPDWYIENKKNNKVIIGFNQKSFWNGGAQMNRGSKYILDDNFHKKEKDGCKILSVVCNPPKIEKSEGKIYLLLKKGFENKRLTFPKGLTKIILDYII